MKQIWHVPYYIPLYFNFVPPNTYKFKVFSLLILSQSDLAELPDQS